MAIAPWAFVVSRASARAAGTIDGSVKSSARSGSGSRPDTALRPVVGAPLIAFFSCRVSSREEGLGFPRAGRRDRRLPLLPADRSGGLRRERGDPRGAQYRDRGLARRLVLRARA